MKRTKKPHRLRNSICILLFCGIVGLIWTSVRFFGENSPMVGVSIQLSFDGAADGIGPNGSRYQIADIVSDTVLDAALKDTSLDEKYTAEQIRPFVIVKGSYPEEMAEQVMNYESLLNFTASRELTVGDYYPTTFRVSLTNQFDQTMSKADLTGLLENIVAEYKIYFAKRYANNLKDNVLDFDLSKYDYPQQMEIIQSQLELLAEYAQSMFDKDPEFVLEGKGFNDIYVRFVNLIDSDINRMNANLTMNALTRNTARLLVQYQYEVRNLNNQLEKKEDQLKKMDSLIESYDKNEIIYLSTVDSLTKIDGNSSETYDILVDKRKDISDEITQINSDITSNQLKIADLLKDTSTGGSSSSSADAAKGTAVEGAEIQELTDEEIAAAAAEAEEQAKRQIAQLEEQINALVEKKDAVIADFRTMLSAYNEQEINDLTVSSYAFKYKAPSVLSTSFIKEAMMTAGPICAIGFMLCMILIIIGKKKEEKQKEAVGS